MREDRLQYQTNLINKLVSNPKSLVHHAASLQRDKTGVSRTLGPNGSISNDSNAVNLLAGQYFRTFQPIHTNYIDEMFTCNPTGNLELDQSVDLVYRKLQHLKKTLLLVSICFILLQ